MHRLRRCLVALACSVLLWNAAINAEEPRLAAQHRVDAVGDPLPKGIIYRLGTTRLHHWVASGLCFTPDGKQLLSVGQTDDCLVWDVTTGKHLRSQPRSSFPLAISRDSRRSIAWVKKELQVLEWPDAKLVRTTPLEQLQEVVFAKDNKTLVALTTDHWVYRWDLGTGKELSRRQMPLVDCKYWGDPPGRLSRDGRTLVGILQRERSDKADTIPLRFWDVATGEEVRPSLAVARSYYDCRWSPDGTRLFALVLPYGLEIWDLTTGKKVETDKEKPGVKRHEVEIKVGDRKTGGKLEVKERLGPGVDIVEATPDGQGLLMAMFGQLAYFDLTTAKTRWSRRVAPLASGPLLKLSEVISFAFSPASKTVAVGCSCGHIALIDWTTGKDVEFSSRHPGFFREPVVFSNDGSAMLIGDASSNRLSLREVRTGKELRRVSEGSILAWSPDGKRLVHEVSGQGNEDDSKYLQVKDAGSGKQVWKITAWPTEAWYSSDGKLITYWDRSDRTFHRVDADTGKPRHVFKLPPGERQDAEPSAISTDQKRVAVKAKRVFPVFGPPHWNELQVWDIDGKKLWARAITEDWVGWDVHFLPDNKHLVIEAYVPSQKAGTVLIRDAATGKRVRELPTGGRFSFRASSPDGHSIVVDGKKAIEVRDVVTGRLLIEYNPTGMRSYMHRLVFAPNGKLCALSPDDFSIEVRELATGKIVAKFDRPTYFVRNITFAPDSRTIALTFNDCTIWMWDALEEPAKRDNR